MKIDDTDNSAFFRLRKVMLSSIQILTEIDRLDGEQQALEARKEQIETQICELKKQLKNCPETIKTRQLMAHRVISQIIQKDARFRFIQPYKELAISFERICQLEPVSKRQYYKAYVYYWILGTSTDTRQIRVKIYPQTNYYEIAWAPQSGFYPSQPQVEGHIGPTNSTLISLLLTDSPKPQLQRSNCWQRFRVKIGASTHKYQQERLLLQLRRNLNTNLAKLGLETVWNKCYPSRVETLGYLTIWAHYHHLLKRQSFRGLGLAAMEESDGSSSES